MNSFKEHERLKIKGGKHLAVEEHTVEADHPLHWHSFFEIEIILSGAGKYVINDVAYDMAEHNMFFSTSTDFHYLKIDAVTRVINISFDEDVIDEKDMGFLLFSQTKRAYKLERDTYERLVAAAALLRHECEIGGECQRQLLQYVLKSIFRQNPTTASSAVSGEHCRGIKKAIMYMEMHFKEDISLRALAAEAGYHPTYFSELFKKVTGETYMETLTKLRIGCARTLLANGFSVSDSCFLSGFGSLSNFSASFKKHCHMSPGTYKAKLAAQGLHPGCEHD